MKNARLLSTVAATLLLAVGAASAQDVKKDEAPARAPAAQQNAPAEKVAPAMKPGAQNAQGKKAPETTGQAPEGDRPKASDKSVKDKGAMDNKKDKGAAAKDSSDAKSGDMKAKTNDNTAQGATGAKSSQSTTEKDRATTGQGAAAGSANSFDRAAHQDQHHHQAAQGGAGASQRVGAGGNPGAGERAFLSAAGGSVRGLSRVARLQLHPGRRPDPRHQSANA